MTATTLIIARHGNTFEAGEPPRRVGARTDLPLTETGRAQARAIGAWLKDNGLVPDVTYASQLRRTIETGEIAVRAAGYPQPVYSLDIFNEIDYGPDEDRPEDAVRARLGTQALADWDERAIVPDGWKADPVQIIKNWQDFAAHIRVHDDNETILAVTSNGIARFAPHITDDFEDVRQIHGLKIATGAVCVLRYGTGKWTVQDWNISPNP